MKWMNQFLKDIHTESWKKMKPSDCDKISSLFETFLSNNYNDNYIESILPDWADLNITTGMPRRQKAWGKDLIRIFDEFTEYMLEQ